VKGGENRRGESGFRPTYADPVGAFEAGPGGLCLFRAGNRGQGAPDADAGGVEGLCGGEEGVRGEDLRRLANPITGFFSSQCHRKLPYYSPGS
jgi:hypothetical protein